MRRSSFSCSSTLSAYVGPRLRAQSRDIFLTTGACVCAMQLVEHPDYRYRIASTYQTVSNYVRVCARVCVCVLCEHA
jgi:hypothetical protein